MSTLHSGPSARTRPSRIRRDASVGEEGLRPWRIVELLGRGALARVYSARHESGRTDAAAAYAVKVLRRKWWDRGEVIDLFRREAYVCRRVRHPGVITIVDARLDRPPYFLVMPRLKGCTLEVHLRQRGGLAIAEALWIARQIAEGLTAIQDACRMTHGDVKPSNLFLSPHKRVTLLDLGFARAADEHATAVDRPTLCSLAYAAPETITSARTADIRSDIYSLGATLYEMISGQRPYEAPTAGRLIELLRAENATCLRRLLPEIPRPVAALVHRMLAKEPLRRPQSYAELVEQLVRLEIQCFASR